MMKNTINREITSAKDMIEENPGVTMGNRFGTATVLMAIKYGARTLF
jgi:hypothetical protein